MKNSIISFCRYQPVCWFQLFSPQHYYKSGHPSACFQAVFLCIWHHTRKDGLRPDHMWTRDFLEYILRNVVWNLRPKSPKSHATQDNETEINQTRAFTVLRMTPESQRGYQKYHSGVRMTTIGEIALFRIGCVRQSLRSVSSPNWGTCILGIHQHPSWGHYLKTSRALFKRLKGPISDLLGKFQLAPGKGQLPQELMACDQAGWNHRQPNFYKKGKTGECCTSIGV